MKYVPENIAIRCEVKASHTKEEEEKKNGMNGFSGMRDTVKRITFRISISSTNVTTCFEQRISSTYVHSIRYATPKTQPPKW